MINGDRIDIGIIGLGYVGLPLATEFAKKYNVIGFDINKERVKELNDGLDTTLEVDEELLRELLDSGKFVVSNEPSLLASCNVYIVTVPTPTDKYNRPILEPLYRASETIGHVLSSGNIVIYESTVYPGATEEECIPLLERASGLRLNIDFFVGYSPERINPGDRERTVSKIMKITSGSTPDTANFVDALYSSIITAGTHKASTIKIAEAAKVIENAQRDINIAFVNELSKIFNLLGIDTQEVLQAAGTKWNFMKFSPGLVGGHCIGVDPYYLAQKAQEVGYHPEIILAGRRTNDGMGKYVAHETIKQMMRKGIQVLDAKVLILGFAFKENCPDVRNTRVIDIYKELISFDMRVDIHDPWVSPKEVLNEYGIEIIPANRILDMQDYNAIIIAVAHEKFKTFQLKTSTNQVIFDVKSILPKHAADARL